MNPLPEAILAYSFRLAAVPPGGEKGADTAIPPMRRAPGVTPGLDNFAPLGNSSDDAIMGTKPEGIHPTGGEKIAGTAVPSLGNSSDGVGQGSESEGTSSRSETLAPSLRLAAVPPRGEKENSQAQRDFLVHISQESSKPFFGNLVVG